MTTDEIIVLLNVIQDRLCDKLDLEEGAELIIRVDRLIALVREYWG